MATGSMAFIAIFLVLLLLCVRPLGLYIANVMEARPIWPLRVGARLEAVIYRLCGVDPKAQMSWQKYALALLVFNLLGGLTVYALQRLQVERHHGGRHRRGRQQCDGDQSIGFHVEAPAGLWIGS